METQQQTKGNAITVHGEKPVLHNSVDRNWIICHAYMMLVYIRSPFTIVPFGDDYHGFSKNWAQWIFRFQFWKQNFGVKVDKFK